MKFPLLALLFLLVFTPSMADTFDSPFFELPLASDWQVSRSPAGLWSFERTEPFELSGSILVNRLKTTPEMYLQGTLKLWETQGRTEAQLHEDHLECMITPPQDDSIFKYVVWEDDLLVVASFKFPVKHQNEALAMIREVAPGIVLHDPPFEPEALRAVVEHGLATHQNTPEELSDASQIRTEMTSFRLDWEPYFKSSPPPLFTDFLEYLEARYDAAFVADHGAEMGMPASLLESRLKAIQNRRDELEEVIRSER